MTRMASDGWVSAKLEGGLAVHVKVSRGDRGEVIARSVLVEGPEITTDTLRQLQPMRLLAGLDERALRLISQGTVPDGATTLAELRSRASARPKAAKRRSLGRPSETGDDGFYRQVADAYRSAATESSKPAMVLGEENGVPVETVRRWIKETRRRGFLPPATRGRAG